MFLIEPRNGVPDTLNLAVAARRARARVLSNTLGSRLHGFPPPPVRPHPIRMAPTRNLVGQGWEGFRAFQVTNRLRNREAGLLEQIPGSFIVTAQRPQEPPKRLLPLLQEIIERLRVAPPRAQRKQLRLNLFPRAIHVSPTKSARIDKKFIGSHVLSSVFSSGRVRAEDAGFPILGKCRRLKVLSNNIATAVILKTRFALRWRGELPSRQWLDDRFKLFSRITLPSIKRQRLQDFEWAILTDPDWEDEVSQRVRDLNAPGRVTIIPVTAQGQTTKPELRDTVRRDRDRFLVVRLDSDDALAPDCLHQMLERTADLGPEGGLINLPQGVVLDWETGTVWKRRFRETYQGPFYGLAHGDADRLFDTGGDHRGARANRRIVTVNELSWLQTCHGGNIDNSTPSSPTRARLKDFLKKAWHAMSPSTLPIDDIEPVDSREGSVILRKFGVDPVT